MAGIEIPTESPHEAMMAERERCAKIAEDHAAHLGLPAPQETSITHQVGQEIATRIRSQ